MTYYLRYKEEVKISGKFLAVAGSEGSVNELMAKSKCCELVVIQIRELIGRVFAFLLSTWFYLLNLVFVL